MDIEERIAAVEVDIAVHDFHRCVAAVEADTAVHNFRPCVAVVEMHVATSRDYLVDAAANPNSVVVQARLAAETFRSTCK